MYNWLDLILCDIGFVFDLDFNLRKKDFKPAWQDMKVLVIDKGGSSQRQKMRAMRVSVQLSL